MHICVLSPHRDDAAFSCGLLLRALLAAGARVAIVNVCTGSTYAPYSTLAQPSDLATVTELRKREDDAFLEQLTSAAGVHTDAVEMVDLGWLDAPDRWGMNAAGTLDRHASRAAEVRSLGRSLGDLLRPDVFLAPMALGGHVDHSLVKAAAIEALPAERVAFYEDLPYAARIGSQPGSLRDGSMESRCYPPAGNAAGGLKQQFAACYPSQIDRTTAEEIEAYARTLGGRERLFGPSSVLTRIYDAFQK